jgi:hypothetical protein
MRWIKKPVWSTKQPNAGPKEMPSIKSNAMNTAHDGNEKRFIKQVNEKLPFASSITIQCHEEAAFTVALDGRKTKDFFDIPFLPETFFLGYADSRGNVDWNLPLHSQTNLAEVTRQISSLACSVREEVLSQKQNLNIDSRVTL